MRRPLRAGGGSSLSRPGASRHRHTHFELRRRLYPAPPTQPLPRPNPPPSKLSCGIHSPKRWAASFPNRFHSCITFMTICRSVPLLSPFPPLKEGRGTGSLCGYFPSTCSSFLFPRSFSSFSSTDADWCTRTQTSCKQNRLALFWVDL